MGPLHPSCPGPPFPFNLHSPAHTALLAGLQESPMTYSVFPLLSQRLATPASKYSPETVQSSMSHLGMAWSLLISCQYPLQGSLPTPSISVHAKFISWEAYTKSLAHSCCKEGWLLMDRDTGSGRQPRQGGTDRHGTSLMLRISLCSLQSSLPAKGQKNQTATASSFQSSPSRPPTACWVYLQGIQCPSNNFSSPALAS